MNIAVFGTGAVGKTLARRLDEIGNKVTLGTRDPAATMARDQPDMFGQPPVASVAGYLKEWFGCKDIIDLGDITNARGLEMLLPLWARIYGATQNPEFAFKVVR